jgi:signal transduction histidine kinase
MSLDPKGATRLPEPAKDQAVSQPVRKMPFFAGLIFKLLAVVDRPVPEAMMADPECARRARLVARFGLLGAAFGMVYATFYLVIGHKWGAAIIITCSSGFAATPLIMWRRKAIEPAAHFLSLTLTLGFTALCFVEGGLQGHAIAWLVSVPLCSLILVGQRLARRWALIAFFAASVVAGIALAGVTLPVAYDPKWESVVSSAGYLGLIIFMFILGLIFENGRAQAFGKMQDAVAKLAASNEQLVHLNNEKNEFLGIAAHDLKNPLTVIAASAQMVGATKDQDRINKLSKNIAAAANRMTHLITDLLNVNAIEQGKFTSQVERCDLRALVEQGVENNQPAATRKQIAFRVGTSDGLWAKADSAATLQILDNLISNALKYSPPNTTVSVHTLPERETILVTVRDEGPGISQEDQKKLFQKFTRLSARPTGGESSTGLGLAIVKRLAEAMSGSIQCQSTIGLGATFMLRLPAWPKEASAPPNVPSKASQVTVITPAATTWDVPTNEAPRSVTR